MAALLPGFEYDIFISYRHNDNKGDGWVTGFIEALKTELGTTFKDHVSIYHDQNVADGLLDTHQVKASLDSKLSCLVFVPIVSQTYCDPKSYAWNSEFLHFKKSAAADGFGLNVKLASGNVASRIMPVSIHELDSDDTQMLEKELGPVRSVEFIFKSAGVNRPLLPFDDQQQNLKRTVYRNQVNKVSNSIKDIITAMKRGPGSQAVVATPPSPTVGEFSEKSIAVLPFVNMSNDPEQEYFSDGISEEIINTLVQLDNLKVAGRTSAFSFKNRNEDIRVIAEKLNVSTVLEGSVRKSGNRIRITAQLIEASSGFHLWSQKFDRELNDVFLIQDEIAKAIVDQLKISLSGKPERTQTQSVEAYQLYLKGMAFFYKRGLDMFEGMRCFESALKIDPQYALAYVGLADTYTMLCFHSYLSPEEVWPKALAAAKRALQLAPDLAEAHTAMATIVLLCERDFAKAEAGYLHALELSPQYLQARTWYALFYLMCVRVKPREAVQQAQIAVENDPLSAYSYIILCGVCSQAGLHEKAIAAGLKAVECDPGSFSAWHFLGLSYSWSGDIARCFSPFQKALEVSGRHNWTLTSMLVAHVNNNQLHEAGIVYNELLTKSKLSYVAPSLLAIGSAAMGKDEQALQYARAAVERRDPFAITGFEAWPDAQHLREVPGCEEIRKMLGFGNSPDQNTNE
jgi:adenylate cyclase